MSSPKVGPQAFLQKLDKTPPTSVIPRAVIELSEKALEKNYKILRELAHGQSLLPLLKANAYGHGIKWVSQILATQRDLYALGVSTLDEGVTLRESIKSLNPRLPVHVFSETTPWTEVKGLFCEQNGLTPIIANERDWEIFIQKEWYKRIPYELEFNLGMNYFGISFSWIDRIIKDLKKVPSQHHPIGILGQLSLAQSPESHVCIAQLDKFQAIRSRLGTITPSSQFHIADSAGIWNSRLMRLKEISDVVRPGISLYGIPPWPGAANLGILPVMNFKAAVLSVRRLKPGETIGYGAEFKVKGSTPENIALLGVGFADGLKSSFHKKGMVWLEGKMRSLVGSIGMDHCAVQCSEKTQIGEWAELWGENIDPWKQASSADSIPHEWMSALSSRILRIQTENSSFQSIR